jgi:glucose-6-phosphate dehydrogenase assembly protein OpcA
MEPVRVDVRSVEKELAGLWRRATEGGMPGVSAPATRVLLANVLVYARDHDEADQASAVLTDIAGSYPARTIISDAEETEPGHELDADVSMLCNITELGRRLCGEEVRLHAHGQSVTSLGTILPVLEPDLPVYLWTPGEINPDDPVYGQLLDIAEHWIVDSGRFSDLDTGLDMLTNLAIERDPFVVVHDLAWAGILPWREALARLFDPTPAREYLSGIRSVEITCSKGLPVEARLIGAWLSAQFGLDHSRVQFDEKAKRPVDRVKIASEVDGRTGEFSVGVANGGLCIETSAPNLPAVHGTVVMEPERREESLLQILDAPDRDRVYERAIQVLRGQIGSGGA